MKIGIFSDCHFGFAEGKEREADALNQALQAMAGVLNQSVDAVLLAGDLFDECEPSPAAFKQALICLDLAKRGQSGISVQKVERDGSRKVFLFRGVPVVSIHGTHEHRPKGLVNALEVLESANSLVHLHANSCELSLGNETVVIHGLSGVPEKVAKSVLDAWSPKPVANAFNILVLHQSIREFLPTDDEMSVSISLSDLPNGFDLTVNGHLHWPNLTDFSGNRFLLTGSTLVTQMKKLESQKPKGYWILDTLTKQIDFFEIPRQRSVFYEKMVFDNADLDAVRNRVDSFLGSVFSKPLDLKPLVRIKLAGSLQKGLSSTDLDLNALIADFKDQAIFSIDESFSDSSLRQKISELRSFQQNKRSVLEMGLELLQKNLDSTGFGSELDSRLLFEWLSAGEAEKAMEYLASSPKKAVVEMKEKS